MNASISLHHDVQNEKTKNLALLQKLQDAEHYRQTMEKVRTGFKSVLTDDLRGMSHEEITFDMNSEDSMPTHSSDKIDLLADAKISNDQSTSDEANQCVILLQQLEMCYAVRVEEFEKLGWNRSKLFRPLSQNHINWVVCDGEEKDMRFTDVQKREFASDICVCFCFYFYKVNM